MKSTFLMTNVAPMTAALNCGQWSDLETLSRYAATRYDSVRIHVTCLYLTSDSIYIGGGKIRVPSHFSREMRVARNDSLLGIWICPN